MLEAKSSEEDSQLQFNELTDILEAASLNLPDGQGVAVIANEIVSTGRGKTFISGIRILKKESKLNLDTLNFLRDERFASYEVSLAVVITELIHWGRFDHEAKLELKKNPKTALNFLYATKRQNEHFCCSIGGTRREFIQLAVMSTLLRTQYEDNSIPIDILAIIVSMSVITDKGVIVADGASINNVHVTEREAKAIATAYLSRPNCLTFKQRIGIKTIITIIFIGAAAFGTYMTGQQISFIKHNLQGSVLLTLYFALFAFFVGLQVGGIVCDKYDKSRENLWQHLELYNNLSCKKPRTLSPMKKYMLYTFSFILFCGAGTYIEYVLCGQKWIKTHMDNFGTLTALFLH